MVYSDLNAILLGEIVRRVSGAPLDVFVSREVYVPLGLDQGLIFRPPRRLERRIAPTGLWHGHPIAGVVNDPNAAKLDKFVLVGHSMTTVLAQNFAAAHGTRLHAVVLCGPANVSAPGIVARLRAPRASKSTSYERWSSFSVRTARRSGSTDAIAAW